MFFKQTLPAWIWALLIFILCAIPGRDIPHISFLELLSFDKLVHASMFFILLILLNRGLKIQNSSEYLKRQRTIVSLFFCIVYGGLLEIMQGAFFIERTADIYDFIANTAGAITGVLLFRKINGKLEQIGYRY